MSIPVLSNGDPTVTVDELRAAAAASNFVIEGGSANEATYLSFANSFDAICKSVNELPEYHDPRLAPVKTQGDRQYHRPDPKENPLNAWSHKTHLVAADPAAAKGPLAGKVIAIKDNVALAGLPHTLGAHDSLFESGKHPISPIDATIVQRILKAGGTIKGTSTCENLSLFPMSFTSDSGNVGNAWLPGYATGGSSSGSASLVSIAAVGEAQRTGQIPAHDTGDGVDMAIGGDQGGSIRLPAAYSGIYGIKPTHGLVPYTGIAGLVPLMDHTGPMTQSIDDCALLLSIIAGYDGLDFRMTPESPMPEAVPKYLDLLRDWQQERETQGEWTSTTAAKGIRVGVLKEAFELPIISEEVHTAMHKAIERFKALSADVREVSVPHHKHGPSLWNTAARPLIGYYMANKVPSLLGASMPHLDLLDANQNYYDRLANRAPATVNALLNIKHMDTKYGPSLGRKAMCHIYELRAAYDKVFEEVDVLVTPCNAVVGPKFPASSIRSDMNPTGLSQEAMDIMRPAVAGSVNTSPFNLTGHPGMSIPIGWGKAEGSDAQLPIGMQIVGRRWDELTVFKAAKAWEVPGSGLAR